MHRSSLDILEKAQLPGDQAKAILEVMDLELESQRLQLGTKDELLLELGKFRLELRSVLAEFRTEMNERFSVLEKEMKEMRERFHRVELQIQTQNAETSRMILGSSGALLGAFGVMLGLFYFFTNRLGK
jgi:ABC-type phosphate transport system auxiliary subunit